LEKEKATHSSILAWRIPWTTVHGVAKSRTRQSDFHFTSPRDLPDVGFEPGSTILQAESSLSEIVMHYSYPRFFWHLPGGEQPGCSPHWFATFILINTLLCLLNKISSFNTLFKATIFSLKFFLLEKGMATHSRILAWRIPWTKEPGGL